MAKLKKNSGGWSKTTKHEEYIDPKAYFDKHRSFLGEWKRYMPNYFYIVVPRKLVEYAVSRLKGTGYGVIAFDGCRREGTTNWNGEHICSWDGDSSCIPEITVKQKPKRIHSEKVDPNSILKVLRRASYENIALLDEVLRLKGLKDV